MFKCRRVEFNFDGHIVIVFYFKDNSKPRIVPVTCSLLKRIGFHGGGFKKAVKSGKIKAWGRNSGFVSQP